MYPGVYVCVCAFVHDPVFARQRFKITFSNLCVTDHASFIPQNYETKWILKRFAISPPTQLLTNSKMRV